jgi:hypothetical protein
VPAGALEGAQGRLQAMERRAGSRQGEEQVIISKSNGIGCALLSTFMYEKERM